MRAGWEAGATQLLLRGKPGTLAGHARPPADLGPRAAPATCRHLPTQQQRTGCTPPGPSRSTGALPVLHPPARPASSGRGGGQPALQCLRLLPCLACAACRPPCRLLACSFARPPGASPSRDCAGWRRPRRRGGSGLPLWGPARRATSCPPRTHRATPTSRSCGTGWRCTRRGRAAWRGLMGSCWRWGGLGGGRGKREVGFWVWEVVQVRVGERVGGGWRGGDLHGECGTPSRHFGKRARAPACPASGLCRGSHLLAAAAGAHVPVPPPARPRPHPAPRLQVRSAGEDAWLGRPAPHVLELDGPEDDDSMGPATTVPLPLPEAAGAGVGGAMTAAAGAAGGCTVGDPLVSWDFRQTAAVLQKRRTSFRSIREAVTAAHDGDRIVLRRGTHNGMGCAGPGVLRQARVRAGLAAAAPHRCTALSNCRKNTRRHGCNSCP